MNGTKILLTLAAINCTLITVAEAQEATCNKFLGKVITEWLDQNEDAETRHMKLVEEFSYVDPACKKWTAPKNYKINGASIPRPFWAVIGSPYVGEYRNASVVHDFYCDAKTETWQDVHRMFYDACIAGGVSKAKARIMYAAVYYMGPRWKQVTYHAPRFLFYTDLEAPRPMEETTLVEWTPLADENKFSELEAWINENNPSLEEIESRIDAIQDSFEPADEITLGVGFNREMLNFLQGE